MAVPPLNVITPAPGELISAPGVYDIPIDFYHGDCCVGPSISKSGLATIDLHSPAHYFDSSYLNPARVEREAKEHFSLGQAVHTLLLGEDGFAEKFIIRPEEFPDYRSKAAREWRDEQIKAGKYVLKPEDLETIRGISAALARDPIIKAGLLNGEIERSLIWQDKETGVWLKSRPDALPVNADLVADLKTCSSADPRATRQSIFDYGYNMQMALVGMGMAEVCGRKIPDDDFVLVFVETKRPYCVNIKPLDPSWIYYGRAQIRRALRTFADCLSKGEWPGYPDNGITASPPKFVIDRFEAEMKNGLLPEVE